MEIRVLRYFLTIAREGNITNAVNFLYVTQSTLSRQIKDLEDDVVMRKDSPLAEKESIKTS